MAADNDRTLRNVLEKLELLTGERSDGSRRAVLISELNGAIQDLSDQNAVVKKAVRTLEAQFNQSFASITEEMLVRADENSALTQIVTTLKAAVGTNKADIQETKRALATKTMAMAEQVTTLAASVNSNTAGIVEEKRVRVTQDDALAQTITTLTATVNANNNTLTAAIQNEQTARANADTAEANARQTLTATVNSQAASISTNSSAIASINGTLTAQWYVQATLDGAPAGSIKLTGIKNKDGSITKNVAIDGNLIVTGTITVGSDGNSPIAQNAISNNGFNTGSGSCGVSVVVRKNARVALVGTSDGGSGGGPFSGANGGLRIKRTMADGGVYLIGAQNIRSYGSSENVYGYSAYTTAQTTLLCQWTNTTGADQTVWFTVHAENGGGGLLGEEVKILVTELSR